MKIFISGGRGMVGRNLVKALEKDHIVSAPSSSELNLLNYEKTHAAIKQFRPEVVIHAAGIVGGIQANINSPTKFLVENWDLGKNLVLAASENNVSRFLNIGSSCMYPKDREEALVEEDILSGPLEPTNEGYALAKISVQRLCSYISKQSGRAYKTIIPCNLYGPYDKFDEVGAHLIPAIIRKVIDARNENSPEIEVWGSGQAKREFMYVGDLVNFIQFALNHFDKLPELLNVGTGIDYTINEYYETVCKVLNYDASFKHDLEKPEGMRRKLVSTKKLKDFGWESTFSLEQGIEMTINYYLREIK